MSKELEILRKRINREIKSRKQAEAILEKKALELFQANQSLLALNNSLEKEVQDRTEELQKSEQQYRHLVENATDIIFNVDSKGIITFINLPGLQQFGYDECEMMNQHFISFIPDDFKDVLLAHFKKVRDEALAHNYHEFPVMKSNGHLMWLGQNINRVDLPNGSFYYSSFARDITQRKETEIALMKAKMALKKSEIKYRSIIENMELGLLEVDNNGTIIKVYDRFNEMTGYERDELVGCNANKMLLVAGYEDIMSHQNKNRLRGETGVYEIKVRKKDGTEIWVLVSGAPFYNEKGEVIGSIGVHYDITDRKNLQFELEKARHKAIKAQQAEKQFLANMSHEIRTPLNAVIGMSHLLRDTDLSDEQYEYLELLSSSANILMYLISDILDLSKIDAGAIEVINKPFDLKDTAVKLINTFTVKTPGKPVKFSLQFDSTIDRMVIGDPQLLNQVLINLLGNADKFTKTGNIILAISLNADLGFSYRICFEVIDTGVGIAEENIQKIFQQFKQASGEIRTKFGGTGLGLTISNQLVTLMGGNLSVQSKLGQGSTFFFTLEFEKGAKADLPVTENKSILKPLNDFQNYKVLVVEDNEVNLKYIGSLLNKWQLQFSIARNGQEAVTIYQEESFDLIFMDLQMPIMDGFEATCKIRELESVPNVLPIIALTASTFLSKKQMALEEGMTDFLSKPFTPDQLIKMLYKYLKLDHLKKEHESQPMQTDLVNDDLMQNVYGNDIEYAHTIFETFLEIIEDELSTLKNNLMQGDASDVQKQAHKMKPTFAMVGLPHLTDKMAILENLARGEEIGKAQQTFEEVESEMRLQLPNIQREKERFEQALNEA